MPPARKSTTRAPAKAARETVAPDQLAPAPVLLVTGNEGLLADRAIAAVLTAARAADPQTEVERLDAAGYETGRLALATSPSLFGGGRVVLVENVESANDALVAEATRYVGSPEPDVCVLLRHGGGQRAKGLLDAARAAGAVECACLPITRDEEKVDFAAAEFRRARVRADATVVRALVDAVGSDLRELAAACSQLAADASAQGAAAVDADTVERYFGGRVEVTGFKVADATVAGQKDEALRLLRHALATGADPVPLVAAIAMKVRALCKVSAAGRGRAVDLARELAMAPWQVERAQRELRGWREDGLATAVLALAEADAAVKGGGRDPVYAVERCVLTIASARSGR
jgi:DNA polymerase III subunit delta